MQHIYQSAKRVVVWLGDEITESYLGMNLIPKLIEAGNRRSATGDRRTISEYQPPGYLSIYNLPFRFD